jgi:hypothetical protein
MTEVEVSQRTGSHSWPQTRHLASGLPLIAEVPGRPELPHLGHGPG